VNKMGRPKIKTEQKSCVRCRKSFERNDGESVKIFAQRKWCHHSCPIPSSVEESTEIALSPELQRGKAAEHLVVADLLLHGYCAFMTDAGIPYDVVIDMGGGVLKRIQVKSTAKLTKVKGQGLVYRFTTRRAKGGLSRIREIDCDYFAFVALDIKVIAYFKLENMRARTGSGIKQTVDLKTRNEEYIGRTYTNGTVRTGNWGRFLQDFEALVP
jgi:hypothetical protein